MRTRAASLIALCSVVGLAGCGSSTSTKGSTTLASFPKNTVFAILPTTTPSTTTAPPATDPGGALVTAPPATVAPGASTYTIVSGDYLIKIAKKYNCNYKDIMTANNYSGDPAQFPFPQVGGTLALPATCKLAAAGAATTTTAAKGTTKTTTTTAAKGATTTTAKGATTVPSTAAAGGTYTVVAGDTLSGIAKKVGTTAQAIADANGYTGDLNKFPLVPGKAIKLPAKA